MHKTHIFEQKINPNFFFYRPTYPFILFDRYRKQTIFISRPNQLVISASTVTKRAALD